MRKLSRTLTLLLVLTMFISSTVFAGIPIKEPIKDIPRCKNCFGAASDCIIVKPMAMEVIPIDGKPEIYTLSSINALDKEGYWLTKCRYCKVMTATRGTVREALCSLIYKCNIISPFRY